MKNLTSRALCCNGPSLLILNKRSIKKASNLTNSTHKRYLSELKAAKKLALSTNIDSNFFDNFFNITNSFLKIIKIIADIFLVFHKM